MLNLQDCRPEIHIRLLSIDFGTIPIDYMSLVLFLRKQSLSTTLSMGIFLVNIALASGTQDIGLINLCDVSQ